MTKDEIVEMARQATNNKPIYCRQEFTFSAKQLQAFARLVAAKEKEACAKLFDDRNKGTGFYEPHEPAEIIRAVANNNNPLDGIRTFARAIEAKLKEKNT